MPVCPVPQAAPEKPQDERGGPCTNDGSAYGLTEKPKSGRLQLAARGQRPEQPDPGTSRSPRSASATLGHRMNIDGHWLSSFHVTRVRALPQRLPGRAARENRDAALTAS